MDLYYDRLWESDDLNKHKMTKLPIATVHNILINSVDYINKYTNKMDITDVIDVDSIINTQQKWGLNIITIDNKVSIHYELLNHNAKRYYQVWAALVDNMYLDPYNMPDYHNLLRNI